MRLNFGMSDVGAGTMPVIDLNASSGLTQAVTKGIPVEKRFAVWPIAWKAGGKNGSSRSTAASIVTEMLASTRTRGPRSKRLSVLLVVEFAKGAVGAVELLPQFAAASVERRASRRGRPMEMTTSALSLSVNSKPMGMEGLKASPSRMSTSVTLTLNGRGVNVDPGKPTTPLFVISVSSMRTLELSGTCYMSISAGGAIRT